MGGLGSLRLVTDLQDRFSQVLQAGDKVSQTDGLAMDSTGRLYLQVGKGKSMKYL